MIRTARGQAIRTCAGCLAWGRHFGNGLCAGCYQFTREHAVGECANCARAVALKNDHCRLCWNQARKLARETDGPVPTTAADHLHKVRHHQLFFADMNSTRGATTDSPRRYDRRGRPRKPSPEPVPRPNTDRIQLVLFDNLVRDHTRFDERGDIDRDNPWLRWAHHLAHLIAERRGWSRGVRDDVERSLTILLSRHIDSDVVHYTAMFAGLRARGLTVDRVADVLDEMGVLVDDRRPAFEDWLTSNLDGIAPGIAREAEAWLRTLHDGGPRTQPRSNATVHSYANTVRPALLVWSIRRDHLREVTRDDVKATLDARHGADRQTLLIALRSLFRHCVKSRNVFRDPTRRIRVGARLGKLIQPLDQDQIRRTASDAARPADRLLVALAAIHAARSQAIRELLLDDIDLGNRRLTIAGKTRPLDDLTRQLLVGWLDYRRTRWPNTANPHLLVNQQTAHKLTPVSAFWLRAGVRGQGATLEQLRVDRQLEEALTRGPDPLHLAVVFGLDQKTAIRYAASARQLLETPIEHHNFGVGANPRVEIAHRLNEPAGSR